MAGIIKREKIVKDMPHSTILEDLLCLMSKSKYVPLTMEQLLETLELDKKQKRELESVINELLDNGNIVRVKKDRYVLPKDADLVCGVIKFRKSGAAVVIPDEPGEFPTLEVEPWDSGVALHEDRVLARVKKNYQSRKKRQRGGADENVYAKVVRILKRTHRPITGTLKKNRDIYFVIPDDPRIVQDVLVSNPKASGLSPLPKLDEKVVVRLLEWEHRHLNPFGEIISVLGATHSPKAEFDAILHKFNLDTTFPTHVLEETERISQKVRPEDLAHRLDCRNLFTMTIDPDDAKDFDDALSVEHLPKGDMRVGIHIADVSSYVKPGSALDKEAMRRGNSTYLVGTVIPMLPHALSNGICSLVEAEDRLTKCVFITFNKEGRIKETAFANTVIRSNKRLTYKQAYAFMTKDSLEAIRNLPMPKAYQTGSTGRNLRDLDDDELLTLQRNIKDLWNVAAHLRRARMKAGSLELDMPEVKIYVDEEGYADRVERVENDESHQLIEEFMLMANECVAKAIYDAKMPLISRVHDEPDPEKLAELGETLLAHNIPCGNLNKRKSITKLLEEAKKHPQGYSIKIQFLRSLKQACYRASADGHYGLHKEHYTHFTSPIRRYSDLVVHRVFDAYLKNKRIATALTIETRKYNLGELESMAQHLSITEQNSTEAERESVKVKLLEFFERENQKAVKTPFRAIVTDVRNHGMFVELSDSLAFGFIKISSLKDDLYRLESDGLAIVGRKTRKRFEVGQEIKVIVTKVDRFQRQMDFLVHDEGSVLQKKQPSRSVPSPKKGGNKRNRGRRAPKA
ncbi:MAG: ribonuclease R [Verrucomicrobia bacterium CG1_02_43_26]|nr:MAG: ribonuclease R [Verrucomicrobia bacterium CG1_02_43_26]